MLNGNTTYVSCIKHPKVNFKQNVSSSPKGRTVASSELGAVAGASIKSPTSFLLHPRHSKFILYLSCIFIKCCTNVKYF